MRSDRSVTTPDQLVRRYSTFSLSPGNQDTKGWAALSYVRNTEYMWYKVVDMAEPGSERDTENASNTASASASFACR